jgi:hypothetical protein
MIMHRFQMRFDKLNANGISSNWRAEHAISMRLLKHFCLKKRMKNA